MKHSTFESFLKSFQDPQHSDLIKTILEGYSVVVESEVEVADKIERKANFEKWFGGSKTVNQDGSPMEFYHGTPMAGFTEFKMTLGMSYFSPVAAYAENYVSPSMSAIAVKDKHKKPPVMGIYKVYLRMVNPFDTRIPEHRKLYMDEFYGVYGNRTPLSDIGLPDWTDADDLKEWFDDKGYDFDGLILSESHGNTTYAIFNPNQVKSVFNNGEFSLSSNSIMEAAGIASITPDEAAKDYIGPLYHGTEQSAASNITAEGFKVPSGSSRSDGSRYGMQLGAYLGDIAGPVHWLGYGTYLTFSKNNAKMYAADGGKVLEFYLPKTIRLLTINFGSPNTMMKWWMENGYDPKLRFGPNAEIGAIDADRIRATNNLTKQLASKYDAVWFKGKGIHRLLDGDQVCVFDPSIIRVVDKTAVVAGGVGSKVIYRPMTDLDERGTIYIPDIGIIPGTKGVILAAEQFDYAHRISLFPAAKTWASPKTKMQYRIKWAKGGTTLNVPDIDLEFIAPKK